MRQGCISLGETQCHECHRTIAHSERFLAIDEEDGVEVANGKIVHYCVECALRKGYAEYKDEAKGEKVLTFFTKTGALTGTARL
ncbi:MAG: hypothetical protein HW402_962 [Dehalococcoidales bacterium]|nr:hypothetical protein [Dehalococcoidales bacterium]